MQGIRIAIPAAALILAIPATGPVKGIARIYASHG